MAIPIAPQSRGKVSLSRAHAARIEQQALEPAKEIGVDLEVLAVTAGPLPTSEVRRSDDGRNWWVASRFDHDPVALSRGGDIQAPPDVVKGLRSLRAAGCDFDEVVVAHELPGDWTPGTRPPEMVIAGASGAQAERTTAIQETTFAVGWELLRAAAAGIGLATRGAVATGMALGAGAGAIARFDPVVLGGIRDPSSDSFAWIALASWDEVPR